MLKPGRVHVSTRSNALYDRCARATGGKNLEQQ
jgi:hypothetical protein